MTGYTELQKAAAYAAQDPIKFADESEEMRALHQFHEEVDPATVLALIGENERIKARLCVCRDCGGQGEVYSGCSTYQGHYQPPEPDMGVCVTCGGDGVLGPVEDFEALAAERDQLKDAIATPESVFINLKAWKIPKPSLRSMVDLYGEDAQLLEIANLRAEIERKDEEYDKAWRHDLNDKNNLQVLTGEVRRLTDELDAMTRCASSHDRARSEGLVEIGRLTAEVELLTAENEKLKNACSRADQIICDESKSASFARARENLLQTELEKIKAENEALLKDAERYRWLRGQHWNESEMAVVCYPQKAVKLGFDCPSERRLDSAIDAALGKGEQS